ncbi:hypothetical protein BJV82DRAFT_603553 [Fennellomyces sp. T-0311]|nr:hypothetical protein BJV82DRAFT_603553 [Fennellomyces sp. T-0311]
MLRLVVLLALFVSTLSIAAPIVDDDDLTTPEDDQEESLIVSLLMIAVSELGDKTFLIAAVMAMKHPRWAVFTGAFSALSLMAVLSSWLGHVVPNLIPKSYTDLLAAALFFFFGLRMTWEARKMKRNEQQEQCKATTIHCTTDEESEKKRQPVLLEAFLLTFLGEWGDKSQISTIALAASNDVYWVAAGVIVGHGVCTALAVLGGRLLADRISVRTVTLVGAIMFFAFGVIYGHHAYQERAYTLYKEASTCRDIACV